MGRACSRRTGMDYIMHYMPLLGFNEQHGYPTSHQWFQQWEDQGERVIRYFVEPVVLSTNYAKSLGYDSWTAIGQFVM